MSHQRRHGALAWVWPTKETTDGRGNTVLVADASRRFQVRAAFIPQRSSRAEVAGQQEVDIVTMVVDAGLPDVDLWSRVEWNGSLWDVAAPPAMHGTGGPRATRHLSIDLRKRPDVGQGV